jgi:hypothetical protein
VLLLDWFANPGIKGGREASLASGLTGRRSTALVDTGLKAADRGKDLEQVKIHFIATSIKTEIQGIRGDFSTLLFFSPRLTLAHPALSSFRLVLSLGASR